MISEICFSFCTPYIIPGFGPISILVNIGEVRGSVYFSNWWIQNKFFSSAEALRRLHSHKFSVSQTPDRTGNLWGVPGSLGRVCLRAQDSQSCAEEVFASHLLQAVGSELGWECPGNQVTRTKVFQYLGAMYNNVSFIPDLVKTYKDLFIIISWDLDWAWCFRDLNMTNLQYGFSGCIYSGKCFMLVQEWPRAFRCYRQEALPFKQRQAENWEEYVWTHHL